MRAAILTAAVLTLSAGTAGAQQAQPQPRLQRVVMQCDGDAATRRAFTREFGEAPRFVTAEEARRAGAEHQRWTAPRCMTASEHARLTRAGG